MVLVLVPYAHALERGLVELVSAIGERERAARAAYLRAIAPLLSYDPARPAGFAIAHSKLASAQTTCQIRICPA